MHKQSGGPGVTPGPAGDLVLWLDIAAGLRAWHVEPGGMVRARTNRCCATSPWMVSNQGSRLTPITLDF
jgi:hypothetical protein